MRRVQGDEWLLEVVGAPIGTEFKLAIVGGDTFVEWEPGTNRFLSASDADVHCEWSETASTLIIPAPPTKPVKEESRVAQVPVSSMQGASPRARLRHLECLWGMMSLLGVARRLTFCVVGMLELCILRLPMDEPGPLFGIEGASQTSLINIMARRVRRLVRCLVCAACRCLRFHVLSTAFDVAGRDVQKFTSVVLVLWLQKSSEPAPQRGGKKWASLIEDGENMLGDAPKPPQVSKCSRGALPRGLSRSSTTTTFQCPFACVASISPPAGCFPVFLLFSWRRAAARVVPVDQHL